VSTTTSTIENLITLDRAEADLTNVAKLAQHGALAN
jgi:hypothetical protein